MGGNISGGANNGTFLQNIKSGFVPLSSAINFESTINQYYFKFQKNKTEKPLDSLTSYSKCRHPLTGEIEEFLGLALLTSQDGKNQREDLNLVIVLDISGSMGSVFVSKNKKDSEETLIQTAVKCIADLIKELKPNERLGIVLFDNVAQVLQPIMTVSEINMKHLESQILAVTHRGGTNMEIGFQEARKMLSHQIEVDKKYPPGTKLPKNHRIVFMTDAQPNLGGGKIDLYSMSLACSEAGIFTTFIGMGLNFDTTLVNKLISVKGANYLSISNQEEFRKIIVDDFNYIVTPMFFNVDVEVISDSFELVRSYGTNEDTMAFEKEQKMEKSAKTPSEGKKVASIRTLMASDLCEKGVKGGIFVLKIKRKSPAPKTNEKSSVVIKYEDLEGNQSSIEVPFGSFPEKEEEYFESEAIRKAVMLIRYVELMKEYCETMNPKGEFQLKKELMDEMKVKCEALRKFMEKENSVLKDETVEQEFETLDNLRFEPKE
jgi:Ca-activated chloride channel homolog